jgi:hypothetical protein
MNIDSERKYAVYSGPKEVSYKPNTSTSYNSSTVTFSVPPPSPYIAVDRKVYMKWRMQIDFVGTGSGSLLGIGTTDALRSNPLSKIINNVAVTLNNQQVSIQMADVIEPLTRYGGHERDEYACTAWMHDQFQEYGLGNAFVRNPLADYGDNTYEQARGGYPYVSLSNTSTTASVVYDICEPIYLSPLAWGKHMSSAFIGLQNMDFVFNLGTLSRIWSHDLTNGNTITSMSVSFPSAPQLLFNYLTPNELVTPVSATKGYVYPYHVVDRYPSPAVSVGTLASTTITSNNIQLQSIPKRMLIFARRSNDTQDLNTSDVFARITNLSIEFNSRQGLLSAATEQDLYNMARANGVDLNWAQWSKNVGAVVSVDFGKDIGLGELEAPGLLGTYQLSLNATIVNSGPNTVSYVLYIVTISEGVFTITANRSIAEIAVVSREDVLDSKSSPVISYEMARSGPLSGGSFWSSVGSFFKSAANKALPLIKEYGIPLAKVAAKRYLGLGARKLKKKPSKRMRGRGLEVEESEEEEVSDNSETDFAPATITRSQMRKALM